MSLLNLMYLFGGIMIGFGIAVFVMSLAFAAHNADNYMERLARSFDQNEDTLA